MYRGANNHIYELYLSDGTIGGGGGHFGVGGGHFAGGLPALASHNTKELDFF